MTNELNLDNQLQLGDIVGDSNRMVIACTKLTDRIPGDSFATWTAICVKDNAHHPYVVWTVVARPEGFYASNGEYCFTIQEAVKLYNQRGGHD